MILFIVPFATNFGRTEDEEEEDVELLCEEVDDDDDKAGSRYIVLHGL